MFSYTVAYHGNGMYRPGKSGGDSENTPDTKPLAWASKGRRSGTCGKSKFKITRRKSMENNAFMRVDEVAQVLSVSKSYALGIEKLTLLVRLMGNCPPRF